MALETKAAIFVCSRCGRGFSNSRNNFYVNHGPINKSSGHLSCCKACAEEVFAYYFDECRDYKKAMRQFCRKFDIYWSEKMYEVVERTNTPQSLLAAYMKRTNSINVAGKCYDDTLREEGILWNFEPQPIITAEPVASTNVVEEAEDIIVPDDVTSFWGPGYTPSMYMELEQRRHYWMTRFPAGTEIDIGTEALIRQICNLEIDINKDRAAGKPIDKSVNALNTLLGSAMLKPAQKTKDDSASNDVPFGVGIGWCEKHKPIKEPSEEFKDVDGIIKYITIWLYGHLGKMMGKKNIHSKLYEEEMERLRVVRPEYHDIEDEDLLYEALSESDEQWR